MDTDRQERVIGGLAPDFFRRVERHHGLDVAWTFEPHPAEQTWNTMLIEANVQVGFEERLVFIVKEEGRICSLKTTGGGAFNARVYTDATNGGGLMKAAGAPSTVSRKGHERYNESKAGRQPGRSGGNA
jgi:hypothetical protein